MTSHVITIYINGREVWQQLDNNAGDFYFKDGVYMQSGASLYMENFIQQKIQIWTAPTGGNAQWRGSAGNTNWSSPANWTPTAVPGAQTSVDFETSTAVNSGSPLTQSGREAAVLAFYIPRISTALRQMDSEAQSVRYEGRWWWWHVRVQNLDASFWRIACAARLRSVFSSVISASGGCGLRVVFPRSRGII